eukprot:scaffold12976_cov24-Tisochrysis_lutea.AAC.2
MEYAAPTFYVHVQDKFALPVPHAALPLTGQHLALKNLSSSQILVPWLCTCAGKVQDKCIVCPAHGTAFDLASGEVKGK